VGHKTLTSNQYVTCL